MKNNNREDSEDEQNRIINATNQYGNHYQATKSITIYC